MKYSFYICTKMRIGVSFRDIISNYNKFSEMKKTVLMCAVAALALTVSSCGNTAKKENPADTTENVDQNATQNAEAAQDKTVVFVDKAGKAANINVIFHATGEKVTLTDAEGIHELAQYPTASGFGYKNETMDLQGKGTDATLTYTSGTVVELTELVAE